MRSQEKKDQGRIPSDIRVFLGAIIAFIITVAGLLLAFRFLGR
jgi:hypothetical protein